jgi:phospholipid-translocating ATPase
VYNFFEALALCHTVQVAGIYEEDKDRAEEEFALLTAVDAEVPKVFHKSLEELNDEENIHADFVTTKKLRTVNVSNEYLPENRPLSEINMVRNLERSHRRPHSLTTDPMSCIEINNKELISDANLSKKIMQQEFKRTISQQNSGNEEQNGKKNMGSHRRTKSSIPFGIISTNPNKQFHSSIQRISSQRSSTREFYAAPAYTPAQLVERQETMLEKRQLETFIEILDYQASSPDEKALVEACAKLGIIYLHDNNDIYTLRLRIKRKNDNELNGVTTSYESRSNDVVQFKRLQVLEFTSERKRMSVIVMDKFGQIWLYTKGAENFILPLCNAKSNNIATQTQKHINEFAKQGLRTLAIARKKLTKTEFINFNNELLMAKSSLVDRAEKVEICQQKIEMGLDLLGATAVEDALQDNVKDTLESLREAGIKVWVLTGDKVETALNIALSCGHISENSSKYFIVECKSPLQLNEHLDVLEKELAHNNHEREFAILIDGSSLTIAMSNSPERFRDIAYKCDAVLCCRLSPLQKSKVVHLVKTVKEHPVTGAIGDGANDVSKKIFLNSLR